MVRRMKAIARYYLSCFAILAGFCLFSTWLYCHPPFPRLLYHGVVVSPIYWCVVFAGGLGVVTERAVRGKWTTDPGSLIWALWGAFWTTGFLMAMARLSKSVGVLFLLVWPAVTFCTLAAAGGLVVAGLWKSPRHGMRGVVTASVAMSLSIMLLVEMSSPYAWP